MKRRERTAEGTRLLGILGNPVKGSLSPAMQNAAFRHLGIDALYLPFEIPPPALGKVLRALSALRFIGVNVTVPYKEKVLRHLDDVTEEARRLGAVNTIAVDGERLVGHNTDGAGFGMALRAGRVGHLRGESVLVLGAGGAARAVVHHFAQAGCGRVTIANRTRRRALALRRSLQGHFPRVEFSAAALTGGSFEQAVAGSKVIVNTTTVGMAGGDASLVPARLLSPRHVVVDIVYKPLRTPLLAAAERAGARPLDGLGMLLYQGVRSFEIWTGRKAPVEVMRRALAERAAPGA